MSKKLKTPILQKYQRIYEKDPSSRVFAPLAETYRGLGMTDKAFEILREGIKKHPDYVMGYLGLAACYADMEEWTNVYTTLRPFVNKNRDNLRLQKLFGKTCLKINHLDEALETYKYLLFLNPSDKDAAQAVLELEDKESESKNEDEQENGEGVFEVDELDQETIYDDEVEGWETVDLSTKGEISESGKSTSDEWDVKMFQLEEHRAPSKNHYHFENETTEELEKDLKSAPVITHTLVDLYCSQGHIEKAVEVLEKILELNPNDTKTLEKLNEVNELLMEQDDEGDNYFVESEEEGQQNNAETKAKAGEALFGGASQDVDLEDGMDDESDGHNELLSEFDSRVKMASRERKFKIINTLEAFLVKLKDRAERVNHW